MGETTDLTKLDKRVTQAEFDQAVILATQNIRAGARQRIFTGMSKGMTKTQADDIQKYAEQSLQTARTFAELISRHLFGDRPAQLSPSDIKQGRLVDTLSTEDRRRIHFHDSTWWWWSTDGQSRVGPHDTEDLAAESMVHCGERVKADIERV